MVSTNRKRVKGKAYYAHNSKCVAGILKRAGAIAFNAGVIERAAADGVTRLEVQVRGGATYTTQLSILLQNGQIQYRDGRQWALSLRYWSIDGAEPSAAPGGPALPTQLPLFGVTYEN